MTHFDLLRACAHSDVSPERLGWIRERIEGGIDWEVLLRMAHYHGVRLLLYHSLDAACPEWLPVNVRTALENEARTARVRNRFFLRELERVLELFGEHGIRALAFKGPLLTRADYGSLRLRQSGDLDLLVLPSNVEQVAHCLGEVGYVSANHDLTSLQVTLKAYFDRQQSFVRGAPVYALDIHTRIMPPLYAFNPDFEGLWERGAQALVEDVSFRQLSPQDRLLILCHQGVKHQWSRLTFICDVAAFMRAHPELDWKEALAHARRLKGERALCLGVHLAHEVLGLPLPDPIRKTLTGIDWLDDWSASIHNQHREPFKPEGMGLGERVTFHLALQDTFPARVRYVALSALRRLAYRTLIPGA